MSVRRRQMWLFLAVAVLGTSGAAIMSGVTGSGATSDSPGNFVVGFARHPGADGYWEAWQSGLVAHFGAAPALGDASAVHLRSPISGIAATPSGQGYWLTAEDGGVFSYGDARFFGSLAGSRLSAPVVAIEPTTDGGGYWLMGRDGGVFTFGDAPYSGSIPGSTVGVATP